MDGSWVVPAGRGKKREKGKGKTGSRLCNRELNGMIWACVLLDIYSMETEIFWDSVAIMLLWLLPYDHAVMCVTRNSGVILKNNTF